MTRTPPLPPPPGAFNPVAPPSIPDLAVAQPGSLGILGVLGEALKVWGRTIGPTFLLAFGLLEAPTVLAAVLDGRVCPDLLGAFWDLSRPRLGCDPGTAAIWMLILAVVATPLVWFALLRIAFGGCIAGGRMGPVEALGRAGARYASALWLMVAASIQVFGALLLAAIVRAVTGGGPIGGVLTILLVVWMGLGLALTFAVLVVEDLRGFSACGRSWRLFRSHPFRVAGALFAAIVMTIVPQVALAAIPSGSLGFRGIDGVVRSLAEGVVTAVVTGFTASVLAVLYLDLRAGEGTFTSEVLLTELDGRWAARG